VSISFKVLQDTIHAVQADYASMRRELLKTKLLFLQIADNQQAIINALKAANIGIELNKVVDAVDEKAPE
jgi:hypothetical protein